MRIVFDVSPLSVPPTGIGYYIRETVAACAQLAPADEIVAFSLLRRGEARALAAHLATLPPGVARRHLTIPVAPLWRELAGKLPLPLLEPLAGRCDAFVSSEWFYPRQRHGLRVAVVHDLVPLRFPHWTTPDTRKLHLRKLADTARSDLVICNSEATARDVETRLGIDASRLRVARPGVSQRFREARPPDLGPAGTRPYVISVGTLEPRKNLGTVLRAFARLRAEHPQLALVLVGAAGWGDDEAGLRIRELDLADHVVRTGYLAEDAVPGLVAGARAFCWPALFEGFGMPIAEALAAGVPVVCSDDPSLDEAAGAAALRVPATDDAALAAALAEAVADGPERADRVARGRAQVAGLTWEATARVFLDAIAAARA